jgi:predicted metalloprotease
MRRIFMTLIAVSAVAFAATACGSDEPGTPTSGPLGKGGSVSTSKTTSSEPDGPACGEEGASLEGCYTEDTIRDYVDVVLPMLADYVDATWEQMPPYEVVFVEHGQEGAIGCVDSEGNQDVANDESYAYCGPDETVYVGQATVWQFYDQLGDAAPAVGIAHEVGHHIQAMAGVPAPASAEESIQHENQADCVAGTWVAWANEQGIMEYPDDLEDIDGLMQAIASAEGDGRDHGTLEERVNSFLYGYENGLVGCNEFYPNTPLITQ